MFFEHKALYPTKGIVPEAEYTIPFAQADVKRKGKDVTIVATAMMVQKSLKAAKRLEEEGINVEIIDPRTLVPLDKTSILESVKKTSRLVIVDEDYERCGFASEVAAIVADELFDSLEAPIKRVCTPNVPIPFAPVLEKTVIADEQKIIKTVKDVMEIQ